MWAVAGALKWWLRDGSLARRGVGRSTPSTVRQCVIDTFTHGATALSWWAEPITVASDATVRTRAHFVFLNKTDSLRSQPGYAARHVQAPSTLEGISGPGCRAGSLARWDFDTDVITETVPAPRPPLPNRGTPPERASPALRTKHDHATVPGPGSCLTPPAAYLLHPEPEEGWDAVSDFSKDRVFASNKS